LGKVTEAINASVAISVLIIVAIEFLHIVTEFSVANPQFLDGAMEFAYDKGWSNLWLE